MHEFLREWQQPPHVFQHGVEDAKPFCFVGQPSVGQPPSRRQRDFAEGRQQPRSLWCLDDIDLLLVVRVRRSQHVGHASQAAVSV